MGAGQGGRLQRPGRDQCDWDQMADLEQVQPSGAVRGTSRATVADCPEVECDKDQCHEALSHLDEFVDGEVDSKRQSNIAAHLHDCPPCHQQYALEAVVKSLVARSCVEQAPPALRARVVAQLVVARFRITG